MSEKLENKNKRGRLTWASSLCSPAAAGRPSQQAAQPASSSVVFVLDRGRGACPARARHRATPPVSLLAWRLLVALERRTTPRSHPDLSRTLPRPPSLPLLSPSHTRAPSPSPPSIATVASTIAAPPRHASQLRRDPLSLLTEQSNPGELRFIAIAVVFKLRPTRSPSSLRLPQAFPELADDAVGFAVSPAVEPPLLPCLPVPRSPIPLVPELRPPPKWSPPSI